MADSDRSVFLKTGRATTEHRVDPAGGGPPAGGPSTAPLPDLWRYLESNLRLRSHFTIHRGIEWRSSRSNAWSNEPRTGYRRGLRTAGRARQFMLPNTAYVDLREDRPHRADNLPWDCDKLMASAARSTPGAWRIAAGLDKAGLVCSGQFFGLWPKRRFTDAQLLAFVAVLNGPVANGFLAAHSPATRIPVAAMKNVPVPSVLPSGAADLVADYVRRLRKMQTGGSDDGLEELLTLIDAAVLRAYDLPARLEQRLLERFHGSLRPAAHAWRHWDERKPAPGLTLAERVSGCLRPHGSWILDVFQPLPADEAELLRAYGA